MRCFGQTGCYVQHHFGISKKLSAIGSLFTEIEVVSHLIYKGSLFTKIEVVSHLIYKGSFFKLMTYNARGLLEVAQLFVELKVLKPAAFIKLNVMRCLVLSEDTLCAFRNFLALI